MQRKTQYPSHEKAASILDARETSFGWWIVAGCFVLQFLFAGAGLYSFSIFINPLEGAFGWSRSQISLAMSIYLVISGITGPVIGYLIGRFGVKKIMFYSVIGTGLAYVLVSQITKLETFYLSYAYLALISVGIGFIPASSVITEWFKEKRGLAIGISMVGISVGGLVMSPLIDFIQQTYSWRFAFMFLGSTVWIIGLPVVLFIIKPKQESPYEKRNVFARVNIRKVNGEERKDFFLHTKAFYIIFFIFFLVPFAQMGVLQHQVPLLIGSGFSTSKAAVALGITAGLGGLGKLCFGQLSDKVGFRIAAINCFTIQAVGVLTLLLFESAMMTWGFVFLFGFGMGGNIVLLPLAIGEFFNQKSFPFIMGIICISQAVGGASGAYLSGFIFDSLGEYQPALIGYIFSYLCAGLLVTILVQEEIHVGFGFDYRIK